MILVSFSNIRKIDIPYIYCREYHIGYTYCREYLFWIGHTCEESFGCEAAMGRKDEYGHPTTGSDHTRGDEFGGVATIL